MDGLRVGSTLGGTVARRSGEASDPGLQCHVEEQISTRVESAASPAAPSREKQGVAVTDNRCAGQWPLRQLVHTPVITCCQHSARVQFNLCLECHTSTQPVFKQSHHRC